MNDGRSGSLIVLVILGVSNYLIIPIHGFSRIKARGTNNSVKSVSYLKRSYAIYDSKSRVFDLKVKISRFITSSKLLKCKEHATNDRSRILTVGLTQSETVRQ